MFRAFDYLMELEMKGGLETVKNNMNVGRFISYFTYNFGSFLRLKSRLCPMSVFSRIK